jgi:hypothetical protein
MTQAEAVRLKLAWSSWMPLAPTEYGSDAPPAQPQPPRD